MFGSFNGIQVNLMTVCTYTLCIGYKVTPVCNRTTLARVSICCKFVVRCRTTCTIDYMRTTAHLVVEHACTCSDSELLLHAAVWCVFFILSRISSNWGGTEQSLWSCICLLWVLQMRPSLTYMRTSINLYVHMCVYI